MQARPEELEYKNWWVGVACWWPRQMAIYYTQKTERKRKTILYETEADEEMWIEINLFYLILFIYIYIFY